MSSNLITLGLRARQAQADGLLLDPSHYIGHIRALAQAMNDANGPPAFLTLANPKVIKGEKLLIATAVVHLAPATLASDETVCSHATPGCIGGCLNTAGRSALHMLRSGEVFNASQIARVRRTLWMQQHTNDAMTRIAHELKLHAKRSIKRGMRPMGRLNGTSDLPYWQARYRVEGKSIFELFDGSGAMPKIGLYDYTKRPIGRPIEGYHLTFSLAETTANERHARQALTRGFNVAAVVRGGYAATLASSTDPYGSFWGYRTVDGDRHDVRPLDDRERNDNNDPVIVVLKPKGSARGDSSGFVREVS